MLCQRCYGSGRIMGNGMIYEDCSCLFEDDDSKEPLNPVTPGKPMKPIEIDKRSRAYREAIHKIMDESKISREEASKVFEEEFYKIA